MNYGISLTPGFSPVKTAEASENRFNGFLHAGKPLKRLITPTQHHTRLKPGANATSNFFVVFHEFPK